MRRILISFLFFTLAVQFSANADYLIVLDLDRVIVSAESDLPSGFEIETLKINSVGTTYQVSRYLPEFIRFLNQTLPAVLGEPVKVNVFSAGPNERNVDVAQQLGLVQFDDQQDVSSLVKSFADLVSISTGESLREMSPGQRQKLEFELAQRGGQERLPFFQMFTKDLSVFRHDLKKVIIIEDNLNAVPRSQQKNLILAPRWDVNENKIQLSMRDSQFHWQSTPKNPEQINRARNLLIRVTGTLLTAARFYKLGLFPSLPDALFKLQWNTGGRLRSHLLNSRVIMGIGKSSLDYAIAGNKEAPKSHRGSSLRCEALYTL